jgi:hypothetical protein
MSHINILLIGGTISYREDLKTWNNPETGQDIPVVSLLLNSIRINGRGREVTDQYRVTIWGLSLEQDAALILETEVLFQCQLKSRRLGHGTGILTAEITVEPSENPQAITILGSPAIAVPPVHPTPEMQYL